MDTVNCTLVCYPHVQTEAVGQSVPMSEFMSFPPERLEVKDARPGGGWRPAKEPEPKGWTGGAAEPRGHVASLRTTEQRSRGLYTCLCGLHSTPHLATAEASVEAGVARRGGGGRSWCRIWRPISGASGPISGAHLDRPLRRIWRDLLRIGIRLRATRTSPPRDIELWRSDSGDRPPHVHSTTHNI